MSKRLTEKDIVHENGDRWVARESNGYQVYKNGVTHSTGDSTLFPKTEDGKSLAIARCNYLAKRDAG